MTSHLLTFVNHACFYVANEKTLLLVDPWLEGSVFNKGWSLLDTSTSNADLITELNARQLKVCIWFSHEHPDHFSVSFLKKLALEFPGQVTVLFQQTKDKRVVTFLRHNDFEVIECLPGVSVKLDDTLAITVFPHSDGDSYCLIQAANQTILNLNDCALTSAAMCRSVKARLDPISPRVDMLFTQFGYANWIGNPFQPELRRHAAIEKLQRIKLQMETFRPGVTIPFASFVTFSSVENSYLNDCQNSVRAIKHWSQMWSVTDTLRFLKPGDVLNLETDTADSLVRVSAAAVEHWERLAHAPCVLVPPEPPASESELCAAFARHQSILARKLPVLPWLLEKLGLIKPLVILVPDLTLAIRLSYVTGYSVLEPDAQFDISMSSPSVVFLLSNEFGFNTTHVNGRFRTADAGALSRFGRFFMPQNLGRQGYGIEHPFATMRYLAGNVIGRLLPGQ